MLKKDIKVGGVYVAKISGKLTRVRVDEIRGVTKYVGNYGLDGKHTGRDGVVYDVTNLTTGRRTTFRSAAKFRSEVKPSVVGEDIGQIRQRVDRAEGIADEPADLQNVTDEDLANASYDSEDTLSPVQNEGLNEFYKQPFAKPFGQ